MPALFLDAAGTLLHLREPVARVYARIARRHGIDLEPDSLKPVFREVFSTLPPPDYGNTRDGDTAERDWWRRVVHTCLTRARPGLSPGLLDACFHDLFLHYASPGAWSIDPAAPGLLAWAEDRGLDTLVVSNFDRRLHGILDGLGLRFTRVITSADASSRKPDPGIFQLALDHGPYRPGEVVHIGDTPEADRDGAQALGIEVFCLQPPASDLAAAWEWLRQKKF